MFGLRQIVPLATIFILGTVALIHSSVSVSGQSSAIQKGLGVTAYYSGTYQNAESDRAVENIADTGAEWLTILVTQYQSTTASTSIYPTIKTPTDDDLVHVINKAKSLGLKVVLKPHIDIENPSSEWRGRIGQNFNESQWAAWFSTYRDFIGHYAELAQSNNVDQLVIGTELVTTTPRESEWRAVVNHVRARYDGPLTYSANHTGEEINVQWWDAVDYIGVSGYYNLTSETDPTVAEIKAAWAPHLTTLSDLSQQWNRQVVFTELGYRSSDGNNTHPWCHYCNDEALDLQEQADTYQAFYETVYNQAWFSGVYWWGWDFDAEDNGICDDGYSPHLKPAENILRQYYGGGQITLPTTCGETAPPITPQVTTAPPTTAPSTPTPVATTAPPTTAPPTTVPPTTVPPTAAPTATATPTVGQAQCGGLRQEAESAVIGSGATGSGAFSIGTGNGASAGQYIESQESQTVGTYQPNANATYCVTVPVAGTYGIRVRASAANSSSDSLFFYVNGEPSNGNTWYVWATGNFEISDIYTAQAGDSAQSKFTVQLSAGEHELAFAGREQGARLDWFELVLDESGSQPTPAPPTATPIAPLPTATLAPPTATSVPPVATATPDPQANCGGLEQEAEMAETVGLFTTVADSAASGGASVTVPNGQGNRGVAPDSAQKISFCMQVDTPGTYQLRGWTRSPSGFDNSFYVRVDGEPANGILWHTQISTTYVDEYIINYDANAGLFEAVEFTLAAGEHQIEFFLREDGVQLDKIALEEVLSAASNDHVVIQDLSRLANDISIVAPRSFSAVYLPIMQ